MPALPHGCWLSCSLGAKVEFSLSAGWPEVGENLGLLLKVMNIRRPQAGQGVQLLFVDSTHSGQD